MDIAELIRSEELQLQKLDELVRNSIQEEEMLSSKLHELEDDADMSFGQRVTDRVAQFGGSWAFIIAFAGVIITWISFNVYWLQNRGFDPYPFILLNLLLSCLAAIQAPIIMMSQKRQEARDRLRSQHDYQVNLKAELEIRHLNEKLDHLLTHQWERLVQIQQVQIEMLAELQGK